MGVIAGIISREEASILRPTLQAMVSCQAYRNRGSTPVIFTHGKAAIGMANKQDLIYCDEYCHADALSENVQRGIGVYAIVDGIVLDVPRHRKFFIRKGYSLPVPSCSAIVAVA